MVKRRFSYPGSVYGVPQGSNLGPKVLILFVKDMRLLLKMSLFVRVTEESQFFSNCWDFKSTVV